jgi:hypothetical protein
MLMFCRIACSLWLLFSTFAWAVGPIDELLSTIPAVEAEHAHSAGDKRHIVIPVCTPPGGEVIPGWPFLDSIDVQTAIEHGRRPVSCRDIGVDAGSKTFLRLAKYAEIYNQTLLRLEGKPVGINNPDPDDCPPTSK